MRSAFILNSIQNVFQYLVPFLILSFDMEPLSAILKNKSPKEVTNMEFKVIITSLRHKIARLKHEITTLKKI